MTHGIKILYFFTLLILISCGLVKQVSADIPESQRSRNAIKKIKADLVQALAAKDLTLGAPIFIRIFKQSDELELWVQSEKGAFEKFKTYPICTFSGDLGPKLKEGDGQSPEGFYFVKPNQLNPWSKFHLSFNLGYPNAYDRFHKRTGSALMVHGNCVSIGCYAMTDALIEEIYTMAHHAFKNGQPFFRVHVFPFRMTSVNLEQYQDNKWYEFWKNLQQGYDLFENSYLPPNVEVEEGRYIFEK
ncbi:MAG: murein L,D-transpeptidase [Gammaproteobacteria bacterium]|nr:murein L,D-transpeptidase [Gammaproteobacteria bacterium]